MRNTLRGPVYERFRFARGRKSRGVSSRLRILYSRNTGDVLPSSILEYMGVGTRVCHRGGYYRISLGYFIGRASERPRTALRTIVVRSRGETKGKEGIGEVFVSALHDATV